MDVAESNRKLYVVMNMTKRYQQIAAIRKSNTRLHLIF